MKFFIIIIFQLKTLSYFVQFKNSIIYHHLIPFLAYQKVRYEAYVKILTLLDIYFVKHFRLFFPEDLILCVEHIDM